MAHRRYFILNFLHQEARSGLLLLLATVLALLVSNSAFRESYHLLWSAEHVFMIGPFQFSHSLLFFVNEGLMTFFFLTIGLELKRERLRGELKNIHHLLRPLVAALGGVLVPIIIYGIFNWHDRFLLQGWAIPMATDIAFSIGVLSLFGRRVSRQMKIFLLTLAVLDDLAAVVVIGLFYTATIQGIALIGVLLIIAGLWILNRCHVTRLLPYLFLGGLLWIAMLQSGIHATLSGVMLAFFLPFHETQTPLSFFESIENFLKPYVAYGILPIFAFANAGVSLQEVSFAQIMHPVVLGVSLGLVFGKPIGVILFSKAYGYCTKTSLQLTSREVYVIGFLAGIGFTMSLFIGALSFSGELLNEARLGILIGSAVAIILSISLLCNLPCQYVRN